MNPQGVAARSVEAAALPHFVITWTPGQPLSVNADEYRPAPIRHEAGPDVVWVLGSPIRGESIDRTGTAADYLQAGDKRQFLRSLNGEFLILHLDTRAGVLRVANDRFTAIPFYYARVKGTFVGSVYYADLHGRLKADGSIRYDEHALFEFVYLQRLLGTKTYDTSTQFLPAATLLTCSADELQRERYWRPDFTKDDSTSLRDRSADLAAALRRAVARKTSDAARMGHFLSGGLDSRTLLAAYEQPPICFTVAFSENNEYRVTRELTRLRGAQHVFVRLERDHWTHVVDDAVRLGGGMYVFDHALFLGIGPQVTPHVGVVSHGHGIDYLFQGMYIPTRWYRLGSRSTYLRRVRALDADLVGDYLSNISHRLKHVDLFDYVLPARRDDLRAALRASVQAVLEEGKAFCNTPYDAWEYLLVHALSRHYPNTNISSLTTYVEQRTISFENELFDLYLRMPLQHRFSARALRGALRILSPAMARVESANTGISAASGPLGQTAHQLVRHAAFRLTGATRYRHPQAEDRTWPDRDRSIRDQPHLRALARRAARSEALAAAMPALDWRRVAADVDAWLEQPAGGGDFISTLITLDRFLAS